MDYKLGIVIPYYKNSEECEKAFKKLLEKLSKQLKENVLLYIIEDGQDSSWLKEYTKPNILVKCLDINHGVSFARNIGIDLLIDKVEYITFIDSDDDISNDYIEEILNYCNGEYDLIKTKAYIKNNVIYTNSGDITNRTSVWGYAFKTSLIGTKRFNINRQIGEDGEFFRQVVTKEVKEILCNATYYYQYGINNNSLTIKNSKKGE